MNATPDTPRVRPVFRAGLLAAGINALLWVVLLTLAPAATEVPLTADSGSQFEACWDCPDFVLAGRVIGSPLDPLPVLLLEFTNIAPLKLASFPSTARWLRPTKATLFFAFSSVQWFAMAALVRAWRLKRAEKRNAGS